MLLVLGLFHTDAWFRLHFFLLLVGPRFLGWLHIDAWLDWGCFPLIEDLRLHLPGLLCLGAGFIWSSFPFLADLRLLGRLIFPRCLDQLCLLQLLYLLSPGILVTVDICGARTSFVVLGTFWQISLSAENTFGSSSGSGAASLPTWLAETQGPWYPQQQSPHPSPLVLGPPGALVRHT